MSVCVCVCVYERERERERGGAVRARIIFEKGENESKRVLILEQNQQTRSPPHLASILSKVVSRAKESVQLSKALVDAMLLNQLHHPSLHRRRQTVKTVNANR